jgi:glycyl-tRNA synthetase beta chain
MREHQKYFSLQNEQGALLPKFLAVVDSDESNHKTITLGHERVLKARLADASFFWDNDRKISIYDRVDKLKGILFQAKLGTVFEKSVRIGKLSQSIAKALGRADRVEDLNLAARLCKADLTTEMVKEFTNLQGVMGGLYARSEGISEDVCSAIYEHYRPSSMEDKSPATFEGSVLSIADKFDSLMGAFSIGLIPTGSRDPLALRRQALGIIKILLDAKLSLSLSSTADKAYRLISKYAQRSFKDTYEDLGAFFRDRIKFSLREQGYSYDEINAIVDVDFDDPVDCLDRLSALALMRDSQDFYSLATSFKRIKNIVLKAGIDLADTLAVDPSLFQQEEEILLYRKQLSIQPKIRRARRSHQYSMAFELMASLRPEVDQFFDKVLVMADDPALQRNRLSLIGTLLQHFLAVADISEIVVS